MVADNVPMQQAMPCCRVTVQAKRFPPLIGVVQPDQVPLYLVPVWSWHTCSLVPTDTTLNKLQQV